MELQTQFNEASLEKTQFFAIVAQIAVSIFMKL